jgi:hypothetical protein
MALVSKSSSSPSKPSGGRIIDLRFLNQLGEPFLFLLLEEEGAEGGKDLRTLLLLGVMTAGDDIISLDMDNEPACGGEEVLLGLLITDNFLCLWDGESDVHGISNLGLLALGGDREVASQRRTCSE